MRRSGTTLLALVVAVALVAGIVVLASSDGAYAFKVGDHRVSQRSVDRDLKILAEHPDFTATLVGQAVTPTRGSIPSNVTATWLTYRIAIEFSDDELAREHKRVTAADISNSGVDQATGFSELPKELRHRLLHGFGAVRALQRNIELDPARKVTDRARSACKSGRFVSHIVAATEADASLLQSSIAAGSAFADVARANSTDVSTAAQGGELGCLDDLSTAPQAFLSAASTLALGAVSDPVQTDQGFHLILVTDTPTQGDLDAVAIAILLRLAGRGIEIDPHYGTWLGSDPAHVVSPAVAPGLTSAAG